MTASIRSLTLVALVGILLQGTACAPRAVRVLETYRGVEVRLAAPDDRLYLLVDPHRQVLAVAPGTDGRLRFGLPFPEVARQCLSVRASSASGAHPVEGALSFRVTLIDRHASLVAARKEVLRSVARNDATVSAARVHDLASLQPPHVDPLELAVTCAALQGDCATEVSADALPRSPLAHIADIQRELASTGARIEDGLARIETLRVPVESCP